MTKILSKSVDQKVQKPIKKGKEKGLKLERQDDDLDLLTVV